MKTNKLLTRRTALKATASIAAATLLQGVGIIPSWGGGTAMAEDARQQTKPKALVVYFSRTGNTRAVAQAIQSLAGGDLVEITPVVPYPEDYKIVTEQAKQELKAHVRPPIQAHVENMAAYTTIFVGSPNWWGTIAPPVMTFLASHNLSGKNIATFITHEGSGLGKAPADVQALAPGATMLPGLAIRGKSATSDNTRKDIAAWLQKLHIPGA